MMYETAQTLIFTTITNEVNRFLSGYRILCHTALVKPKLAGVTLDPADVATGAARMRWILSAAFSTVVLRCSVCNTDGVGYKRVVSRWFVSGGRCIAMTCN
jgi:hypothetical protein